MRGRDTGRETSIGGGTERPVGAEEGSPNLSR